MRPHDPFTVDIAVRGLWLQYNGLKIQSTLKNSPLETEVLLAIKLPPEEDLPEPGGFMVAT